MALKGTGPDDKNLISSAVENRFREIARERRLELIKEGGEYVSLSSVYRDAIVAGMHSFGWFKPGSREDKEAIEAFEYHKKG